MAEDLLFVGAIFGIIGLVLLAGARNSYQRQQTLATLSVDDQPGATGSEATIEGPVEVESSATPTRLPPDGLTADQPALWVWRVQRKVKRGGSNSRSRSKWVTIESGVAAGEFSIRDEWERIRVDASSVEMDHSHSSDQVTGGGLSTPTGSLTANAPDPFNSEHFYLGDPETEVLLGDPPLLQRLVDEYLPWDLEVTISVGRQTTNPDRYQATIIKAGDELLAHGLLDESGSEPRLYGTDDTPLFFVDGDPEAKATRHRSKALKKAIVGTISIVIGVGVLATGLI